MYYICVVGLTTAEEVGVAEDAPVLEGQILRRR